MGNAITQETWYLWLMLMKDGGWWSVKMLTKHWHPSFAPHEVQQAVDALEAGGFLASCDQGDKAHTRIYAFTSECKTLPDLPPATALGGVL